MTWKDAQNHPHFIRLSEGNSKLEPNKQTRFLIWSLPIIKTCPYATEHCKAKCYGAGAYQRYGGNKSNAWLSDIRHLELSSCEGFVDNMVWTINQYMNRPSYRNAESVVFRIHERGDFYSPQYMHAWYMIARRIKHIYGNKIQFIAYTKSVPYLVEIPELMDVVNVRFSVWDDTLPAHIGMAELLNMPIYTAVDKFDTWNGAKCRCTDCATCGMCWNMGIDKIACEIH